VTNIDADLTSPSPSYLDVTDQTFEADVLDRSTEVPVVVDLWAPWCGPCRSLGPIIEQVIADTDGRVVLAKVNVDDNPGVSQAFQVQGIPAVYALVDRKVVNGFVGAQGEAEVRAFVETLLPTAEDNQIQALLEAGDEESLRAALEIEPDNEAAIVDLAELLVADGRTEDALALLARIPETGETRRVAALARTGVHVEETEITDKLTSLLDRVKGDDVARQEFVDLLELLGPDDPRTAAYRKKLTSRLF